MLNRIITDRRAWTGRSIDDNTRWYYRLSNRCLSALDEVILALRQESRPTTEIEPSNAVCRACVEDLAPVLTALERGRGFAIIDGIPTNGYSIDEAEAMYWLIGQLLGAPVDQNVQGTLLYDVRDTGQDVRYGARFSVTNAESTFHTDNSFGDDITDYVGLLCLRTAKAGGLNQVVSAYTVHNELLEKHRDVLEILYQPFHIDRRGGIKAGEPPTAKLPIMQWKRQELICRYLRYWIEAGHQKVGEPLTAAQINALDCLDHIARRPELSVEFGLHCGQIFFINNRWILHNRSAFEDHAELHLRRHYVRLWLKAKPQES